MSEISKEVKLVLRPRSRASVLVTYVCSETWKRFFRLTIPDGAEPVNLLM
jgi:hypothetical protein